MPGAAATGRRRPDGPAGADAGGPCGERAGQPARTGQRHRHRLDRPALRRRGGCRSPGSGAGPRAAPRTARASGDRAGGLGRDPAHSGARAADRGAPALSRPLSGGPIRRACAAPDRRAAADRGARNRAGSAAARSSLLEQDGGGGDLGRNRAGSAAARASCPYASLTAHRTRPSPGRGGRVVRGRATAHPGGPSAARPVSHGDRRRVRSRQPGGDPRVPGFDRRRPDRRLANACSTRSKGCNGSTSRFPASSSCARSTGSEATTP